MKNKKILLFIYLFFFPAMILAYPRSSLSSTALENVPLTSSLDYGVSNYNVTQSVKYQVEFNFSLTRTSIGNSQFWFQFSRLNDRQPSSALTQYCAPYQESELLSSNILGSTTPPYLLQDEFNNTYDLFNATLNYNDQITLYQKYNITLNEVRFTDVNVLDIGAYNTSENIFDLYCNRSEIYYERNEPDLITASNNIVDISDNPLEKAEKICNWVSDWLTYSDSMPDQEKGALWAYTNKQGDCSEYTSLMVTLLRIQNIPARKVTGFCVSNNPNTRPFVGKEWLFSISKSGETTSTDFLGHAWVEYYVPNIGWIACDPTWHGNYNYINKIDFLRFNWNIGQWFSIPELPDVSEFPNPCIVYQDDGFNFSYTVKITVLETDLLPLTQFPIMLIIFISIGVAAVLITIILIIKRSKKKALFE